MSSVNTVILIGNLGKDPQVRTTNNGKAVATFSIATSEKWKDQHGEPQSKTEWHNIVIWDKLAEIAEKYLQKGSKVYIEGKLTYRDYEGQDGQKKYVTEIVARNLTMLDRRESQGQQAPPRTRPAYHEQPAQPAPEEQPDDLPF